MTANENPFLTTLRNRLRGGGKDPIYPCIRDLIEHGLVLDRFSPGQPRPNRQDITQYLAAWSRNAGLSDEACRDWLIDYCVATLSSLSRRSAAAIRHSTKSNIKYIYKSKVPFLCECLDNRFRARCGADCPVYDDMQAKRVARAIEASKPAPLVRVEAPVITTVVRVKETHRKQFIQAVKVIRDELAKGSRKKRIVELLNERGLKTRTGRKWTPAILSSELGKLKHVFEDPCADIDKARLSAESGAEGSKPPERPGR